MNVKDIPLIIPNFQQLSYLRNLINQFRFYYPENPVVIVDNGSDYEPLLTYMNYIQSAENVKINLTGKNEFIENLSTYLANNRPEYYIISDCDISILPSTPPNFLEVFKTAIDNYGFHHAGFGLITDDIPSWNPKAGWIQGDERALLSSPVTIEHEGKSYQGFRAPIDTCFAMYKRENGGWTCPMPAEAWSNSLRIFWAHHLPWYLNKDFLNDEMKNYFATCKKRELGKPTAGQNHYNPFNGME